MVPTMINTHRSYKTISTPNAPSAIGPYSQAVVHNGLAFVSGCIPFDPQTMQCVDGGVEAQAQRALDNLMSDSGSASKPVANATQDAMSAEKQARLAAARERRMRHRS